MSGSTNSYKQGIVKRTLAPVVLATLAPYAPGTPEVVTTSQTWRVRLRGISANLKLHIACGLVERDSKAFVPSSSYGNTLAAGSMQITPVLDPDNSPLLGLRETFQDPTATDNLNNAMAQALPYGWTFNDLCDEAWIDVTFSVNDNLPALTDFEGQLIVVIQAEYIGSWWQPDVIQYLLGQVNVSQVSQARLSTAVA